MKSEKTIATSISKQVKENVWIRDKKRCIFCHNSNALPEAHALLSRAYSGKGEERNIITVCRACHYKLDNGVAPERKAMKAYARKYLEKIYGNISLEEIKYKKHG